MYDVDLLVESALSSSQLECGCPVELAAVRSPKLAPLFAMTAPVPISKPPRWTAAEDEFLRRNLGYLTFVEIGAALGRSAMAVELRHERIGIPRPLADPRFLTANRISKLLDVDAYKVCSWIDCGLLPGEYIASPSDRLYRRVWKITFLRWVTNTQNWIWFDPRNVADPQLSKLLSRKRELWDDEWWTTPQVAQYHGVEVDDVKRYLKAGRIQGVQASGRGGRHRDPHWANWFVLRSEATRPDLVFVHGRGQGRELQKWSEPADAFLLLAVAVGVPIAFIDCLCDWHPHRAGYRLQKLLQDEKIPCLIEKYRLDVRYRDVLLFADWKLYRNRFPALARSMSRFEAFLNGQNYPARYFHRGNPIPEMLYVRRVLSVWANWHTKSDSTCRPSRSFGNGSQVTPRALLRIYETLRSWNVDPL